MRSSTASVTWTPQNGIHMHPIFNSVSCETTEDDSKIYMYQVSIVKNQFPFFVRLTY